ncbi:MAG: hypothetical protein RIG68_27400 [Imperialibacter sp.]
MTRRITKSEKTRMQNPFIQFFKYLWLNIKIIRIVALGHGGTRKG